MKIKFIELSSKFLTYFYVEISFYPKEKNLNLVFKNAFSNVSKFVTVTIIYGKFRNKNFHNQTQFWLQVTLHFLATHMVSFHTYYHSHHQLAKMLAFTSNSHFNSNIYICIAQYVSFTNQNQL